MKYLDLKYGESVKIGDEIKISLLKGKKGQQYNFGIEAPKKINILREEVFKRNKV